MKINVLDGSSYFKGLLLLIRKDRTITETEVVLMKRVGKALGFEKEFCDNAIRDILENKYISDEQPVFSKRELALMFIKDGLSIAFSDNVLHPSEEQWLKSTAVKNSIDLNQFNREVERAANEKNQTGKLEVDDISIEF
jgi:hypothetical protein